MMTTRSFWMAAFVLATLVLAPAAPRVAAAGARTTVNVTVQYTGAGTVDDTHRLWIWLFDSPDFSSGAAMPLAEQSLAGNGMTATFAGVTTSPVWIAVAYDAGGGFTGSAPPPSGSSLGAYVESGAPAPVTPGGSAEVRVVFDDSMRMP